MSRVMVLEDTDKDGVMDKATPFVEDMINGRCIAFVDDGVLVVESGAYGYVRIRTETYDVMIRKN